MVMEGWALLPHRVAQIELDGLAAVYIIIDALTLEHRLREQSEFTKAVSDEDALIRKFVARSARYNALAQIIHGFFYVVGMKRPPDLVQWAQMAIERRRQGGLENDTVCQTAGLQLLSA